MSRWRLSDDESVRKFTVRTFESFEEADRAEKALPEPHTRAKAPHHVRIVRPASPNVPMILLPDWRAFIELLNDHRVDYVIGGRGPEPFMEFRVPRAISTSLSGDRRAKSMAFRWLPAEYFGRLPEE